MNILVVNAGSSSLKYQLIDIDDEKVIAKGLCERIGESASVHKHEVDDYEAVFEKPLPSHQDAIDSVLVALTDSEHGAIDSLDRIDCIGHRIVQGGSYFSESVLIDEDTIGKIDELAELAPLHNKAAILGIRACEHAMPGVPMVAVFDTSFFQTLPPKAYMYPIPYEYYEKYAIRKYGAHGTSHRYIAQRAAELVGEPIDELKIITCHLGNGCSMAAIDHGVAVDTSMGLTPLDGLMMGTRSGAIDPAIVPFLMEHENMTAQEVNDVLNKKSGLLGVTGISNDLRDVQHAQEKGDPRAGLAYEMYANSVKKYIGMYYAVMSGVDVIVLAAGVGENSDNMRRYIFAGLQPLGIVLDQQLNKQRGFERIISHKNSAVKICVIPTNEELMIARDTYDVVHAHSQIVLYTGPRN